MIVEEFKETYPKLHTQLLKDVKPAYPRTQDAKNFLANIKEILYL